MLTVAAAILLLVAFRWRELGFEWQAFTATFLRMDPRWLGASAAFALLTYLGRALRWQVLLGPVTANSSLWRLFSATAIGFTAIVLLGRAGELVRPYLISVKERVPFSSQLAAWLLERIYDLLIALLIFGLALARVRASGVEVGPSLEWVLRIGGQAVTVLSIICLVVLFLLRQFSQTMQGRLLDALAFLPERYTEKVRHTVTAFVQGVQSTRSHAVVATLVGYTLLEWVLIVCCYWCLFRAFPTTAGFQLLDVFIFVGFVSFGSIVQIPGIGGGVQLVSVVVLTQLYGVALEVASSVAVMLWVITFVVIVPIGLSLAFHEGLSWKRIKELEEKAKL